jgi:hypothetical protein
MERVKSKFHPTPTLALPLRGRVVWGISKDGLNYNMKI